MIKIIDFIRIVSGRNVPDAVEKANKVIDEEIMSNCVGINMIELAEGFVIKLEFTRMKGLSK